MRTPYALPGFQSVYVNESPSLYRGGLFVFLREFDREEKIQTA
jgi:hypothetical protein